MITNGGAMITLGSRMTTQGGAMHTTGGPFVTAAIETSPPLPAFDNPVLVAGLWNFNPVGYPSGVGASGNGDYHFLGAAPYALNWAEVVDVGIDNAIAIWADQNSNTNDLIQSGAARPTLQITTPVVVSGAGTAAANGTYTFTGIDGNGFPYYNKTGTNPNASSVAYNIGDQAFYVLDVDGSQMYQGLQNVSFPWQTTDWIEVAPSVAPAPTVAAGTQSGEIQTDGISQCLQSSGNLVLGTGAVFYWFGSVNDLAATGVIFETGANGLTTTGGISFRSVAGVATASVKAAGGLNTKTKTIADTNKHLWVVVIDTTAAAASQVLLYCDGSNAGVTAPISTDLAGLTLDNSKLSVGARNNGASQFLAMSMQILQVFGVQTPTVVSQWTAYDQWVVT